MSEQSLYDQCNALWPGEIPALSRIEAQRAAMKLWRHFAPGRHPPQWIRMATSRSWISPKPSSDLHKGWRRLVHDVSHAVHSRLSKSKTHGGWHAEREIEMVKYVIDKGWLTGSLKPPARVKLTREAAQTEAYDKIMARIKRWESKRRRAETALKKLSKTRRYYETILQT